VALQVTLLPRKKCSASAMLRTILNKLGVRGFPSTPALVTDCVAFNPQYHVLLVRRKNDPFAGCYALPGGFVNIGETVEAACRREVQEETGLAIDERRLRLVGIYSDPSRDPRGHSVSVAYAILIDRPTTPRAGSDAQAAEWIADWKNKKLSFNHAEILADAECALGGQGSAKPDFSRNRPPKKEPALGAKKMTAKPKPGTKRQGPPPAAPAEAPGGVPPHERPAADRQKESSEEKAAPSIYRPATPEKPE
jgi:8-oxo-dGTP diphosphatase